MLKPIAIKDKPRHFLALRDHSSETLRHILNQAATWKAERNSGGHPKPLADKKLAMLFEKPSTRTRVSFDVGMQELGGTTLTLGKNDIQLGHGESVADTARVLSRFVNAIMLRCHGHDILLEMAEHADVPVINGLTDYNHPCQIMADLMTYEEHRGNISGRKIVWLGDGNNVVNSWIVAAQRFECDLHLVVPKTCMPDAETVKWAKENGAKLHFSTDPQTAVKSADLVMTDTWVSMGQKDGERRKKELAGYQVNEELMALAKPDALFMHCLPAHRGEEVTDGVIDGSQSVVFDEAENRLHAQKAILLWCFGEI